jgi:hypothetical protein
MGYKNWMLVEGRNDQYVLRGLLQHHNIACAIPDRSRGYRQDAIIIDQKENIQGVLDALNVVLDDGDLERLAIVVDADTDLGARWDALRNIFARFGGDAIPRSPAPDGTIITLAQPYRTLSVGVWLMPDNQVPGILENFIGFLVPGDEAPLWQRAKDCVNGIPGGQRHFSTADLPKAQIHTWLAWQREPGQPFGIAITARYLDADVSCALDLVDWVRRVFDLS